MALVVKIGSVVRVWVRVEVMGDGNGGDEVVSGGAGLRKRGWELGFLMFESKKREQEKRDVWQLEYCWLRMRVNWFHKGIKGYPFILLT